MAYRLTRIRELDMLERDSNCSVKVVITGKSEIRISEASQKRYIKHAV